MKKIAALLLALVLAFSLVACGGEKDKKKDDGKEKEDKKDEKTEQSDESEDKEMKVVLSDEQMNLPEDAKSIVGGGTFTIFAPTPYGIEKFVSEAPNGTPLNDSIYYRNLKIQDELGVEIKAIDYAYYTHNQSEKIIDSVLNGDHGFDCAAIHSQSACAALVIANAVLSFDLLEYCDLSKPWWNQGFRDACALNGEDFFAVSSACHGFYTSASCILFNKSIAAEIGMEDPYELVRKKQWTVDKLIQLTKNFSEDLNSDGMYDYNDKLAIISNDWSHMNYFYGAFHQPTVLRNENNELEYNVNTQRMSTCLQKLNDLFHTGRRGVIYDMYNPENYTAAFAEGRVLFSVAGVGTATGLRDYDISFGILPLPMLDETQEEYGTWVDPWHLTLCVPIDSEKPERTGIILEALAYHSYYYVYPALIEQSIFGTGTRDVESLEMLTKYIYPNVFYDFGYIYDGYGKGYSDLIRKLIPDGSSDMSSFIQERKSIAENHFNSLYDAYMSNT